MPSFVLLNQNTTKVYVHIHTKDGIFHEYLYELQSTYMKSTKMAAT